MMRIPTSEENLYSTLPPAYRFHPTDGELITYYLHRKISNIPFPVDLVPQINLYGYEPRQLPALSKFTVTGKEWYFFNLVSGHKKGSSVRPSRSRTNVNRETPEGQWISGLKREILVDGKIVGWKRKFNFFARTNGDRKKTDWYMMEYRSSKDDDIYPKGTSLVISKIYAKITPAQLQIEPTLAHKVVANEGNSSVQDIELDMTLDRESSLDAEQDLYSKKLAQVSTMAMPKAGQSILNDETSSSKTITSSGCLSLPGFWFYPTDNELIEYYLKRKVLNLPIHDDAISEIDLYKWAPWDLPSQSRLQHKNMQWFFFNLHDRTHSHSYYNVNNQGVEGYWSSGTDLPVHNTSTNAIIGMKKFFVFHRGKFPNGKKTYWVMHEYRLKEDDQIGPICVVIKIWNVSIQFKLTAFETHEKEAIAPADKSTCALGSDLEAAKGDNILHSSNNSEQDESIGQRNNVESWHGCNHAPKCKNPNPVAASVNSIDVPFLLLPSIPQNNNNEESTRPCTRTTRIVSVGWHFMSFTRPTRINPWNHETMSNFCLLACCSMKKHKDLDPSTTLTKVDQYSLFLTVIFTKWKQS